MNSPLIIRFILVVASTIGLNACAMNRVAGPLVVGDTVRVAFQKDPEGIPGGRDIESEGVFNIGGRVDSIGEDHFVVRIDRSAAVRVGMTDRVQVQRRDGVRGLGVVWRRLGQGIIFGGLSGAALGAGYGLIGSGGEPGWAVVLALYGAYVGAQFGIVGGTIAALVQAGDPGWSRVESPVP